MSETWLDDPIPCQHCGAQEVQARTYSDWFEGYDVLQYNCRSCGYSWWADAIE